MDFAEGIYKLYSKREKQIFEVLQRASHCSIAESTLCTLSQGIHTGFYFYANSYRYMLIYDIGIQHWIFQRHPNTLPVYPVGLSMEYDYCTQGYKACDSWHKCYLDKKFSLAEGAVPIFEDNIIKKYVLPTSVVDGFITDYLHIEQYPLNNWENMPKFGRSYTQVQRLPYNIGKVGSRHAQKVLSKWANSTLKLGLLQLNENQTITANVEAINSIRSEYNTIMNEIAHIIKKGNLIPYESNDVNHYLLTRSEAYDTEMYERGLSLFVPLLNNIGMNIKERELDETIRYTNTLPNYDEKSRLEVLYKVFNTYSEGLYKPFQTLFKIVDSQIILKNGTASLYRIDEGILSYLAFLHHTYSKKK